MKTVMQELIDKFYETSTDDFQFWIRDNYEYLLNKEKEQIIQAVNKNEKNCVDYCNRIYNVMVPSNNGKPFFSIDKKAGINYYEKLTTNE